MLIKTLDVSQLGGVTGSLIRLQDLQVGVAQ